MDAIVAQSRHLLSVAEPLLRGLDDTHLALASRPGAKTAGWLVGHLAVTGDFARRLCGRPPLCPSDWRARFNPGTTPSLVPGDYPPMDELCARFRAVYADLGEAAVVADEAALSQPNPYAPARAGFPTSGVFVAYMLTGHLGYHLGQLSGWRESHGL